MSLPRQVTQQHLLPNQQNNVYNNRLQLVQQSISHNLFDGLLISSIPNIIYLTGYENFSEVEREAYLLITKNNAFVITDGRYTEATHLYLPQFSLLEKSYQTPLAKHLEAVKKQHGIHLLGIETNDITVAEATVLKKYFKLKQQDVIEKLRMVKDTKEIQAIEKACQLGDKTFDYILKTVKIGMREKELADLIWKFIKHHGADISFPSIVCFGKTSSDIHHAPTDKKLEPNSMVLVDFGVKTNNYCSDMTRTFFVGKATDKQKKMYHTVLAAQTKAFEKLTKALKPSTSFHSAQAQIIPERNEVQSKGINFSDIDAAARQYIIDQGFPTIPHGVGHGIGLEVHEKPSLSPTSKDTLQNSMVFSIEPGIYEPDFGGVRIEDLVVTQHDTPRFLTKSPRELIEIFNF